MNFLDRLKLLDVATIRVFKMIGDKCSCGKADCPTPAKHPYDIHGVHNAEIRESFDFDSYNLGVCTGGKLVVVDLDPRNGSHEWEHLPKLRHDSGFVVSTGGGGHHVYFKTDVPMSSRKLGPGIDFKAEGGYVVGPGSIHAKGKYTIAIDKEIPKIPDWLFELAKKEQPRNTIIQKNPLNVELKEKIQSALAAINPDCDYETWIKIGMACRSVDAFDEWDQWSQGGSKYKKGETEKKYNTFADSSVSIQTLWYIANENGWNIHFTENSIPEWADEFLENCRSQLLTSKLPPAPSGAERQPTASGHIPLPGGFMDEIIEGFREASPRISPNAAVSLSQFISASLFQDKFLTPFNTTMGMYLMHIGGQGCGKSFGQKTCIGVIRKVLDRQKPYPWAGSANGLMKILEGEEGCTTLYKDEYVNYFHKMLRMDNGLKGLLLEIWSATEDLSGQVTAKAEYAYESVDGGVALSVLGAGTPNEWEKLLAHDDFFGSGFGSRLEVIEYPLIETDDLRFTAYPEPTIERLKELHRLYSCYDRNSRPVMCIHEDAKERIKELNRETIRAKNALDRLDDVARGIAARRIELIIRASSRLAVVNRRYEADQAPTVTLSDVEWAVSYVDHVQGNMQRGMDQDSSVEGKFKQKVIEKLKNLADKKEASVSWIAKHCQVREGGKNINSQQRNNCLDELVMSDILDCYEHPGTTKKRPVTMYRYKHDSKIKHLLK